MVSTLGARGAVVLAINVLVTTLFDAPGNTINFPLLIV